MTTCFFFGPAILFQWNHGLFMTIYFILCTIGFINLTLIDPPQVLLVISDTMIIQHIMALQIYFPHTKQGNVYANVSVVADKTIQCQISMKCGKH